MVSIKYSIGMLGGAILITGAGFTFTPSVAPEIFPRENKPSVMRIYRPGVDILKVQNQDNPNLYDVPLQKYLSTIPNKADRNIEKAQIEKLVGWYDDGGRD